MEIGRYASGTGQWNNTAWERLLVKNALLRITLLLKTQPGAVLTFCVSMPTPSAGRGT
jgi:hypothetical protein